MGNLNRKSWIVTSVLAGGALAYAFLVFLPGQRAIGKLRDELRTKRDYITQTAMLGPVAKDIEGKVQRTKDFAETWRSTAPNGEKLASLYGDITACASTAGTTTIRFDPQPVEELGTLLKIPVALGIEGKFEQIFDLLGQIEQLPASIWMENLQIEPNGKDSENMRCEVSLVIFAANPDISD
jgi:Tfp pilus assembly protein PilO